MCVSTLRPVSLLSAACKTPGHMLEGVVDCAAVLMSSSSLSVAFLVVSTFMH